MKKNWKVAAVAAGVLLLMGCGNKGANNLENGGAKNAGEGKQDKGVISSIKDAMGLGKTMRCSYRIEGENGGMEMVSYVKGKSYMTESNIGGSVQKSIFNEEGMFSWSVSDKQGTKMAKACMEELERSAPKDESDDLDSAVETDFSGEDAFSDAMDVKCEEAEADFSVPKDVNFVDQCEMMKKMMDSANDMRTRVPGGGAGNGGNIPAVPDFNVSQ